MSDKQLKKITIEEAKVLIDEKLKDVNGGFDNCMDQEVYCPHCNIHDESNLSYQFWLPD